jgi:uncharacterized protein YbaP (TraB family)
MTGRLNSFLGICVAGIMCLLGNNVEAASAPKAAAQTPKLRPSKDAEPVQPAMWKIEHGKSTVYLLGSVHVLPVNFTWRTPAIDKAIAAADVFMFETNVDFATAEFHYFVDHQGYLPPGQTLASKLSPTAKDHYMELIRTMRLDQNKVDYLRPGVAVWLLQQAYVATHGNMVPGVDATLLRQAKDEGKEVGYLETLQSQFEVLAAIGGGAEVTMLEKSLVDMRDDSNKFPAMLAAWSQGDLAKLITFNDQDPKMTELLLYGRNKVWLPKIEALLGTPKTYLITVGAAHLAGKDSVIDLLCKKHWKIERVQTGSSPPPPACPV